VELSFETKKAMSVKITPLRLRTFIGNSFTLPCHFISAKVICCPRLWVRGVSDKSVLRSSRGRSAESPDPSPSHGSSSSDEGFLDHSPALRENEPWRHRLQNTMLVFPRFISPEEETSVLNEIEPYLKRMTYETSHWDDAIHGYRETERSKWTKGNETIIQRIRDLAFPPGVPQLKLVHILDLAKEGVIKPHIDSVRFCGNTIAGLSLLSDCVMRLRHDVQKEYYCDILLPRLSLYVMSDVARLEYSHEILGLEYSVFKSQNVQKDRRISIICRNEPTQGQEEVPIAPTFTPLPPESSS